MCLKCHTHKSKAPRLETPHQHIQRQGKLIFHFPFPSQPWLTVGKPLWLPHVVGTAMCACSWLVSFVSVGTECFTLCHPADQFPFEELPSLFSKKQLCDHRDLFESLSHLLDSLISQKPGMPFHKPCSSVQLWWWHDQDSLEMIMQRSPCQKRLTIIFRLGPPEQVARWLLHQ